jgi:ATP-dependent protease ClpP protease subunit
MGNWNQILDEIKVAGSTNDIIRRKYLMKLSELTGRNIIIYYSGWLEKPNIPDLYINDGDKIGFMTTIQGLDRAKGLDIILHTPGGETAATESIVDYLRSMFGDDVRAIVPQLAMSAGTMVACSCKSIIMGKQSSLGPIDPQFGGVPAHGIIEEFTRASMEIKQDQSKIYVWQPIIAKYNPTLIGECQKAIAWSDTIVKEWLKTGMLADDPDKDAKCDTIVKELGDHALMKSHSRHLSMSRCKEIGLKIESMEENQDLQDAILTLHHAIIHTLMHTPAYKIIENQNGTALIRTSQIQLIPQIK